MLLRKRGHKSSQEEEIFQAEDEQFEDSLKKLHTGSYMTRDLNQRCTSSIPESYKLAQFSNEKVKFPENDSLSENLTSEEFMNESDHIEWKWQICSADIMQHLEKNSKSNPGNSSSESLKKFRESFEIKFDMSRDFLYSSKQSWSWHRSWTLPKIYLRKETSSTDAKLDKNYQVEITTAKFLHSKTGRPNIEELEIDGETIKEFTHGELCFQKLRFKTTSYKHNVD